MAPRTRKKHSRISYKEEPDPQDSDEFEQVFQAHQIQPPDQSDEESDYHQGRQQKRRRISKGKRSRRKTPDVLPLLPEISDQENESDDEIERSFASLDENTFQPQVTPATITLHLPVHLENKNITLNLDDVLSLNQDIRAHVRVGPNGSITTANKKTIRWCLINALPTEIRVRILRFLLVTKDPIDFTTRQDFERSAQVLQLSRAFHDDGTKILYGENCFHFERAAVRRGNYRDPLWKEVGYKDVRRFLRDIGENKKKLRFVSFKFADALPIDTPYLPLAQRKFVNDAVLMECFAIIADHTILEKFAISTTGRATVSDADRQFLRALTRIKCYDLSFPKQQGGHKIAQDLMDRMRVLMETEDRDRDPSKKKNRVRMPFEQRKKIYPTPY